MSVFDRRVSYALSQETANRKLQLAVTRLQFGVAGISNFSKVFIL